MGQTFDDLIGRIADGQSVDWRAEAANAHDSVDRELLEQLRLIARLNDTHRSESVSAGGSTTVMPERRSDAGPRPALGSRWGKYLLHQHIGDGGFGEVLLAGDDDLNRDIAIKLLHPGVSERDAFGSRLLNEAKALARVRHGNVVTIHGVETHGGRIGLCMEFIDGRTLDARVRTDGPFNAEEASVAGQAVARGLGAVHLAGLLHRDVKAKNVMRERNGRYVLMDLGAGLDRRDPRRVAASGSVGTPLYMAPELFEGEAASVRSDIYSLGVLLYFLVTGAYPVEGGSSDEVRRAHADARRIPLLSRRPDLPDAFVRVVERALAPLPEMRFKSSSDVVTALGHASGRADSSTTVPVSAISPIASLVAAVTVLVALGAISSRYFNMLLGRSDFAEEGLGDWLKWGSTSLVAPLAVIVLGTLSVALLVALRPLLLAASAPARRWDASLVAQMRRVHLDNEVVLAACALLVAGITLAVTWWANMPTLVALASNWDDISLKSASALAIFGPEHTTEHVAYRERFAWCTFVCGVVWYPVWRVTARRQRSLNPLFVAGGLAILGLSLALMTFPYRVTKHNEFEGMTWRDQQCYALGERAGSVLLFCPALQPPRNRIVSANDPQLVRSGVVASIFQHVGQAK